MSLIGDMLVPLYLSVLLNNYRQILEAAGFPVSV
jgi:hypothetical protein